MSKYNRIIHNILDFEDDDYVGEVADIFPFFSTKEFSFINIETGEIFYHPFIPNTEPISIMLNYKKAFEHAIQFIERRVINMKMGGFYLKHEIIETNLKRLFYNAFLSPFIRNAWYWVIWKVIAQNYDDFNNKEKHQYIGVHNDNARKIANRNVGFLKTVRNALGYDFMMETANIINKSGFKSGVFYYNHKMDKEKNRIFRKTFITMENRTQIKANVPKLGMPEHFQYKKDDKNLWFGFNKNNDLDHLFEVCCTPKWLRDCEKFEDIPKVLYREFIVEITKLSSVTNSKQSIYYINKIVSPHQERQRKNGFKEFLETYQALFNFVQEDYNQEHYFIIVNYLSGRLGISHAYKNIYRLKVDPSLKRGTNETLFVI
jgi:hypothetical protein